MSQELTPQEIAERSLIKTYRKTLWNPFIAAVKRYELVSPGDHIAVCISGGKDSVVLANLMQELQNHTGTALLTKHRAKRSLKSYAKFFQARLISA